MEERIYQWYIVIANRSVRSKCLWETYSFKVLYIENNNPVISQIHLF